jgi:Mlc titration factor MtfA (ptsG expression regulator)
MRIARRSSILNAVVLALIVGGGVAVAGAQVWAWGAWLGLVPVALILGLGLRRPLRRWRLARASMPRGWRRWLRGRVPLYEMLDDAARTQFEQDVRFVMDEYSFEGVKGVEVTETLRLSVAAGAATLLHGRPSWELPGSRSVLFYPGRFNDTYYDSADAAYDGMAHEQGPIILTAPAVEQSWADPHDADNVVLHELAHLFDFDNEGADGVPSFVAASSEADWQALVQREMRRVQRGRSVLRPYAAEAPSEFFAVAVETFFEQPHRMARHHDALFRALVAFFHLDPRTGRRTATVDETDGQTQEGEGTDQVTGPADDAVTSR